MAVFLDNTPFDVPSNARIVRDVVDAARPGLETNGRLIVTIGHDGAAVPDEEVDAMLERPLAGIERLDLLSASKRDLATTAMDAAGQLLSDTRARQATIIDMLAADDTDSALSTLAGCLQDWGQAHAGTIQIISLMNIDVAHMTVGDRPGTEILQEVVEHLTQLRACIQEQDYVLLSDTLQYELLPFFDDWEGFVSALGAHIATCAPPT